ncbi:MAG: hypothetical protein K6B41_10395 [Butyrivibrio sp.]|nr:hypothetical protein [Butyrivibrio sp.]
MIAEINQKTCNAMLSHTESLEDELTGDFFGTLRYFPYMRGLHKILLKYAVSYDKAFRSAIEGISTDEYFDMEFWKKSKNNYGEMDAFLSVENVRIGIDNVYRCPPFDDNAQLIRDAKMMNEWCETEEMLLLLVAREEDTRKIYIANCRKPHFQKVHFGYITWENIFLGLDLIETQTRYEEIIVKDLRELLKAKGFMSFDGFDDKTNIDGGLYYDFG